MESKPSIHYYFVNIWLRSLVFDNYKAVKEMAGTNLRFAYALLLGAWQDLIEKNPDAFINTDLIRDYSPVIYFPNSSPFKLELIDEKPLPLILYIGMPKATITHESAAIVIIIYKKHGRLFTLELGDNGFIVSELTRKKHYHYGSAQTINDFLETVKNIITGANPFHQRKETINEPNNPRQTTIIESKVTIISYKLRKRGLNPKRNKISG